MDITVLASGSRGNCYRVSDGATVLLLDAGITIDKIRRGCNFRLHEVYACLVTHSHQDHCSAVPNLCASGIDVYMPGEEIKAARNLQGPPRHHHRLHVLEKGAGYKCFPVGTFSMLPFPTEHDTPEPVGYFICSNATGERLVYFTDTYYLRPRFPGVTHIIGEINYDRETLWEAVESDETPAARAKRLFTSHMGLDTFLAFLDANDLSKLRQVYICHMSDAHGSEAKIKEAVQRRTGAEVTVC